MKILVLVSSLQGGGAERVAVTLCNAWANTGHDVTVMVTYTGATDSVYPIDPKVTVAAPDYQPTRKNALSQLRRLWSLRTSIIGIQPDRIVSFLTNVNVAAILATRRLQIPVIVSERIHPAQMVLGKGIKLLRKLTYPLASHVIVQTQATAGWFAKHLPRANVCVIPNPCELPLPRSKPILDPQSLLLAKDRIVLGTGRLDAQKGFLDLLHAFANCTRGPDWKLVILGEGEQRAVLQAEAQRLTIFSRVLLPGWCGNPEDWFNRADIFVLSSKFEGFPNALLEAMACGTCAISYDCPAGPAEMITQEESGLLVAPASGVRGLEQSLSRLIADPDLRSSLGKQAAVSASRFSLEKILKKWRDVLTEQTT